MLFLRKDDKILYTITKEKTMKTKKEFLVGYAFGTKEVVRAYSVKEAIEIYCYDHMISKQEATGLVVE
jgi:hypothetical protein